LGMRGITLPLDAGKFALRRMIASVRVTLA
jgi:hypothetical protein